MSAVATKRAETQRPAKCARASATSCAPASTTWKRRAAHARSGRDTCSNTTTMTSPTSQSATMRSSRWRTVALRSWR